MTAAVSPPRGSRLGSLKGLPARIGQVMLAPRAAMARVERQGGGLNDALWLIALGTVTFRFPQLLEALLGLAEPALDVAVRVVAVASNEVVQAAWIVLPAAVLVTALAGARRDASRDLELGATCYVPYFVVRGLVRTIDAVAGARTWPPLAGELPAVAAALVALVFAVRVARARPTAVPSEAPGRGALVFGLGVLAMAGVGLAGHAVWSARHLSALQPMRRGEPAPAFILPRADGTAGTIALSALRGQVVVLDFWATWCPPCLQMLPILHDLHAEWSGRGVTFVGVNSDGNLTVPELQEFLAQHPASYPIVLDEGDVNRLYKVRALPQLVVIGRDGTIRKTFVGFTTQRTLAHALSDALDAPP